MFALKWFQKKSAVKAISDGAAETRKESIREV